MEIFDHNNFDAGLTFIISKHNSYVVIGTIKGKIIIIPKKK